MMLGTRTSRRRQFLAGLGAAALSAMGLLAVSVPAAVPAGAAPLSAVPVAAASTSSFTGYVVNFNANNVVPLNTGTNTVGTAIPISGLDPYASAITPEGATDYVS